jgi:long-chain acyl-CoA synthetase
MNQPTRLFDFLYQYQQRFSKADMFAAKENGKWKTYGTDEIILLVNQLSAGLLQLGLGNKNASVEQQDKIAVISKNRPEWLILDLACQQIGVILCPVYPTTHEKEIAFIFNDAAVQYVFVSGDELLYKMKNIQKEVASLKDIFSFDETPEAPHWKNILNADTDGIKEISSKIRASDCATIIYTSGTTGTPKGVMLSHHNIVSNVLNAVKSFPFPAMPDARALSFLPLNHIFERVASYIYMNSGISIYYAESMETIGNDLKEVKPVLFTTVPRLLEKVYEKIMAKGTELSGLKRKLFNWAVKIGEQYDISTNQGIGYYIQLWLANKIIFNKWRAALGGNVKYLITGGAACQVKLLRIFTAAGVPIFEGYGPTENSPVISVNCRKKGGRKFGTVGLVIEGQEVRLEADGEICVKGPSVMMGYYKRPDLTNEVIIDGWLHTGDIGVMEDGMYLKITDRKKELFKTSGGKYVAPQVIENKIKESAFVEQIMVIGAEQKFVAALIVPSYQILKNWIEQNNIDCLSNQDIIGHPSVIAHYETIIHQYNQLFNPFEQIKKFELIAEEWCIENGELTPKLSMKRKVIMERHKLVVENLYQ